MNHVLLNLSLFKAGWVAVVFAAAAGVPLLGVAAIAVIVAIHLTRSSNALAEVRLLVFAAALGFVWESLLVSTDVVRYGAGMSLPSLAPYWIVALWVLFATTLNVGMRWLRKNLVVASVFGAVGGPLSFFAGMKTGAVSFPDLTVALVAIGLGWAILLPILVSFAGRSEDGTSWARFSGEVQ